MNKESKLVQYKSMNKLFLIKNPDLFQGRKSLRTDKNYFEGWYFKNTNNKEGISFIPGISTDTYHKKAFIQIITKDISYFVDYDINDFKYQDKPFRIEIGKNIFSKDAIDIEIEKENLKIYGKLKYSKSKNIQTNIFNPNIMGPFSYIQTMECNHAILNMTNKIDGTIKINDKEIVFNQDNGYIEKDWGCSFPKSYIWCQGNNFQNAEASFMCSIADIPLKMIHFRGIICVLLIGDKEYKFTTYNHAKLIKYNVSDKVLEIVLKKGNYYLQIRSQYGKEHKLTAPVNGKMEKDILESISSSIEIILKEEEKIIFSDISSNCGLEIVQ